MYTCTGICSCNATGVDSIYSTCVNCASDNRVAALIFVCTILCVSVAIEHLGNHQYYLQCVQTAAFSAHLAVIPPSNCRIPEC